MTDSNTPRTPKNIILCSDGTGNRGGKGQGTNVWRLHNYIDLNRHKADPARPRQLSYYDDGVGTEDIRLLKVLGGAFGWGLSRNIRELYYFLVQNYEPGDNIFLFGFSRGAFTVRSLAGLIGTCGIIDRTKATSHEDLNQKVKEVYKAYRRAHREKNRDIALEFGRDYCFKNRTIRCVGVWDTVDAIGVPFDELRTVIDRIFNISFHKHDLGDYVEHGFHALSIDDERQTFHPVMWNEKESAKVRHDGTLQDRRKNSVQQVWFAGVHSNVGGGYPKQGLSYISLYWMMHKASGLGLDFEPGALEQVRRKADAMDKLYDSRSGAAFFYRYLPRDIDALCEKNCEDGKARIHFSVLERIDSQVLDYAPGNFPRNFTLVSTDYLELPPDPDEASFERIREKIASHRANPECAKLLSDARYWIWPRHYAHILLLLALAVLVAGAWYLSYHPEYTSGQKIPWLDTAFGIIGYLPGLLLGFILPDAVLDAARALADYYSLHPWRLVTAILIFAGLFAYPRLLKCRMTKKFKEYWFHIWPLVYKRRP